LSLRLNRSRRGRSSVGIEPDREKADPTREIEALILIAEHGVNTMLQREGIHLRAIASVLA
jgi:hypothetical protein